MINLPAATLAALASDNFEYAHVVSLPVNLFYTNHGSDLVIDGQTYESNGLLVKLANIKKNQEVTLDSYNLELSNVDNAIAKAYAAGNYRGLAGTVSIVLMVDGVIQGDPIVLYKGTLDSFSVRENLNDSSLSLKLTSHWASYNQKAGRYTSDKLQQDIHAGDDFFKYAHVEQSNIGWGKR